MDTWTDSTLTSSLIITNDESFPEKQEYTRDGTVDVFGMPAHISKTGGIRAIYFILASTIFGQLAYSGVNINLVLFLKSTLMEDSASAAINANSLSGFTNILSLFGAFISDAYLGRYWSSVLFFSIYLLGNIAASVIMYVPGFSPPYTTVLQQVLLPTLRFSFFVFLYISAIGSGGYQPCITTFGADQFDDNSQKERVLKIAFFNWFYISCTSGDLLANIVIVYIEDKYGYALGFALSTGAAGLAVVLFLLGTPIYRLHRLSGNPFSRAAKVIKATIQKWHVQAPMGNLLHELHDDAYHTPGTRKIPYSNRFRFLDKAATLVPNKAAGDTSHLCTVTQVEEVKCLINVLPVWISIAVYGVIFAQVTIFLEQSAMMDTRIGNFVFPPTYIFLFESFSIYIWAIIYETIIQPIASRSGLRSGLTSLQRIGIGLISTILCMAAAALVEKFRRDIAVNCIVSQSCQISVLWQIPLYFFMGASEVFTYMGQMEFFYDQAPDALRGLGSALATAAIAAGRYSSDILISIIVQLTQSKDNPGGWIPNDFDKGRLDLYFWLLAFLAGLNLVYFVICSHSYKYTKMDTRDEKLQIG